MTGAPSPEPLPIYVHGTSAEEQARLGVMNRILNEGSLREMALGAGERILDLGCGLGVLTRAMRRAAGPGGVAVGVEWSEAQRSAAIRLAADEGDAGAVDFRAGDATKPPLEPDEWGTFDVAHTRFLLEHVRDPLAVVRPMVRAVRPGGRVILQDEDHSIFRMAPALPRLEAVWEAYYRSYERIGNDPYVGRHLVTLLHEAGAIPRRTAWIFFGGCAGMEVFPLLLENMRGVLEGARAAILEGGSVSERDFTRAMEEYAAWGQRPDAAWWFALAYAEGTRPAA